MDLIQTWIFTVSVYGYTLYDIFVGAFVSVVYMLCLSQPENYIDKICTSKRIDCSKNHILTTLANVGNNFPYFFLYNWNLFSANSPNRKTKCFTLSDFQFIYTHVCVCNE